MKKQLEDFFGCTVNVKEYKGKLSLPIYMTMRKIRMIEMGEVAFGFIDMSKDSDISIAALKKQKKKYEEAMQCPVAFKISLNSLSMRNAMIKNGIAFIDLPGNVFLPFMGVVLQDMYKKQLVRVDKMMPSTQLVFLELFYMEDGETVLKSQIASRLNLTKTSITRATAQLKEMGLIEERKSGTEISVKRNLLRKEYYERAKKYLINPVQKTITVVREDALVMGDKAGETALSNVTQLNPPQIEARAIYKGSEIVDQLERVDSRVVEPFACVHLQLWKYDPVYFAKDGNVDAVSLACTFIGNEDERIEMCIEELLEEI